MCTGWFGARERAERPPAPERGGGCHIRHRWRVCLDRICQPPCTQRRHDEGRDKQGTQGCRHEEQWRSTHSHAADGLIQGRLARPKKNEAFARCKGHVHCRHHQEANRENRSAASTMDGEASKRDCACTGGDARGPLDVLKPARRGRAACARSPALRERAGMDCGGRRSGAVSEAAQEICSADGRRTLAHDRDQGHRRCVRDARQESGRSLLTAGGHWRRPDKKLGSPRGKSRVEAIELSSTRLDFRSESGFL